MIQPAQYQDISEMLLLLHQLFGIEEDFAFDAEKQQKGLELLLRSPDAIIMVAKEDNTVMAMGTAQLVISTAEGGPSLLIEDVVVRPDRQNLGIGSRLLQTLGEWGATKGARRMQLLADRSNATALGFYRHAGWQQTQLICLRKFHRERNNT